MISFEDLKRKYHVKITGVLHVGAHLAEESEDYVEQGISRVWWVEGNQDLIRHIESKLRRQRSNVVINALVYEEDGAEINFNVSAWEAGMCSSILEWGTHPTHAPWVKFDERRKLRTRSIDSLVQEYKIRDCNFLNLDLQGAELHALKGGEKFISEQVDYIFTEINIAELYKDCARVWEMDAWLFERGFVRAETAMAVGASLWGDAFYIRRPS